MSRAELTIREVVQRTGVEAPTLRMWEQRHGFPDPQRLPSGHRRYSENDVALIQRVTRNRESGMELRAAIEGVRGAGNGVAEAGGDESIYAGLRRRRPDLSPYVLPKATLVGLSHAIEDECGATAERSMLFASFQRERFYRQAEARWRDLTATSDCAIVMADFPKLSRRPGAPVEVPIDRADPIGREWSLICDAPRFAAVLSAWERPGQDEVADAERTFETIWSVEPELVRDAALVAAAIAERAVPEVMDGIAERLAEPVRSSPQLGLLTNLASRMVAYVGSGDARRFPAPHSSAAG